jgi:alpha-beta hydrolase superfamily lysophospholipase
MTNLSLRDGSESFGVTLLEAAEPARVVLFAVGGGGNPERHRPLLEALAANGCQVIAPHFERLSAPAPSAATLQLRARRLQQALDTLARSGLPVAGVGHSIGTTMLLALVGARAWTIAAEPLTIAPDDRIDRLALLAPATDFFRAPGALSAVHTPILAWAGTRDLITPVAQAEYLAQALATQARVELRVVEGANHFSFMHALPPQVEDTLPDRAQFLSELIEQLCRFITG